ncbi:uncharacterized protein KY384_005065, partial [Bacidia gigantensis]|uniref:uncharacterized protein n=1 Tax=Bacidia gigantensis TaxID=2732470 RepID=UPI001D03BF5C
RHGVLVLTSVPDEIFSFLGLCGRRYEEGFATLDELFVWMVRCRFFRRDVFVSSKAKDKDEGEGDMGKKGGGGGKKAERWMKGQFVRTWLVQHPEIGIEGQKDGGQLTKAMVLNEALDRFEKREEYQGKLARHKNEREISGLWGDVATTLPLTGRELGAVMVELKDAVRDGRSDSALEAKIDGLLGARGSSAESLLAVKCVIDDLVGIVGTIGDGEGKGDVDVDSGA